MLTLRDKLALTYKRPAPPVSETPRELPGFTEIGKGNSRCLVREVPLAQLHCFPDPGVWPAVASDPGLEGFVPEKAAFLDVETTGLYTGAGALAFLIGVGVVRNDRPTVCQIFLRDHRDEPAALDHLAGILEDSSALVTYNGKCFDWPLIKDRYGFNRMAHPHIACHLDLLHTSRRLWKHEFSPLTLGEVETRILGVCRTGDIEGYLIPSVYARYLREGVTEEITRVVEHNRQDIESLFNLTLHCGHLMSDVRACSRQGELLGAASGLLAVGREEDARLYLEALARQPGRFRGEAAFRLALLHKRRGNWDEALACWEEAARQMPLSVEPLEEMAKYYEHVARDMVTAHALTHEALRIAVEKKGISGGKSEIARVLHRIRRLEGRLERSEAGQRQEGECGGNKTDRI